MVVVVDENGEGLQVYDIGSVPQGIVDTGEIEIPERSPFSFTISSPRAIGLILRATGSLLRRWMRA